MNVPTLTCRSPVLLLFLCLSSSLVALSDISGKVVGAGGEPLAFANVLLLQEDSTFVKGDLTSDEGRFRIEAVEAGGYLLSVTMLGYAPEYRSVRVSADQPLLRIGEITLREEATQLAEVEVKARKPLFEQQSDRMVINVQNSLTGAGGTALNILERSPGVLINRQSGSISVGGKSGVVIMLNGKESYLPEEAVIQMLQGMPAENIERIELLTAPPARYDAEGNAGFINIVLKKNEHYGTNGMFSLNAGYGVHEKYGGNLNLNHRAQSINLFGDYSFTLDHTYQEWGGGHRLDFDNSTTQSQFVSYRDPVRTVHNARLGIDYEVGRNTVLGVLVSGYDNKWDMDAFNEVEVRENGRLSTTMGISNQEVNHWRHLMGNFNLHHTLGEGENLSLNADYLFYHDDNPTDYFSEMRHVPTDEQQQLEFRTRKVTPLRIWVGKADYTRNVGERLKLETGLKGAFSRFENDVRIETLVQQIWQADPDLTQVANLREDILAAYGSFRYNFDQKTTLSGGLRYEYTITNLSSREEKDIVDRQYGLFFPSLHFSWHFDDRHAVQASYNRRISRPQFDDLAPFVIFLDPNTFFSNNAALQPGISNSMKAGYQYRGWSFSVSYTHEDEAIAKYQPRAEPEDRQLVFAAVNLDFLNTWNGTVAFPIYFTDWWEAQHSITGLRQHLHFNLEGGRINTRQWSLNANTTHSFRLPADFSLEVAAFYQSESLFGYSRMGALGAVNLGLQKEFGDGGKLRLSYSDIFNTNNWSVRTSQPAHDLDASFFLNFESRKVMLTYSRSFGSQQVKGARQRSTGSEAERRRVGN